MKRYRVPVLVATLIVAGSVSVATEPNPKAPESLRRAAFLIGEWEVTTLVRNDEGAFVASPVKSRFRARWLHDGYSMLTEYYEDDPNGFYGVHVVTWDEEATQLVFRFFNAKKNRRREFRGGFDGDVLRIANRGGYAGDGDYLFRESDTVHPDGSFEKRIHRSDDGGKSWNELGYRFTFAKAKG